MFYKTITISSPTFIKNIIQLVFMVEIGLFSVKMKINYYLLSYNFHIKLPLHVV